MRSTLLLSLLVIGAGCGDHGLPPGGEEDMAVNEDMSIGDMGIPNDAEKIVTFTMFAADYAQALCNHYMACGELDAAQMPACIERNLRHTGWDQDVEIEKGRMEINELQCLSAIDNARCDFSDVAQWSSLCLQFLYKAKLANGAACIAGVECTSGFCQHAGSDAGTSVQVTGCQGTCADPNPAGAACRLDTDCTPDSFCDSGTQQCTKLGALNAACVNFIGNGSGTGCQFGLNCPTFPSTMSPTCSVAATQTALHGACDPAQGATTPQPPCGVGMYCQLQYTATTTACTPAGGECVSLFGYCDTGSGFCQAPSGGSCEAKIAATADCDPNNDAFTSFINSQCVDGTLCEQLTGQTKTTCQKFSSANDNCNGDGSCKVGLYCKSGKCAPWFSDGQACDTNDHCPSETQQAVCIADNADAGAATTCEVTKNVGGACAPAFEDSLCEPADLPGSSYCAPSGSSGTCAPKCF
ncbi:MAG TPA: hypothetical protein VGL86_30905 [Polyangia bacterium]|jgi:hypothetical protein